MFKNLISVKNLTTMLSLPNRLLEVMTQCNKVVCIYVPFLRLPSSICVFLIST